MPIVKVRDIAFGRLQSPDLDQAERFLLDFGMVRAGRTKDRLYMRGTDPAAYLHVTELGEPKFLGMAFYARSAEDLDRLTKVEGASKIEALDGPGGGKRVRLRDPHGFTIEVVHGIADSEPLPLKRNVVNFGTEKYRRAGELTRLPAGPAQVKRMGHGVIATTDLKQTLSWYRETLGFLCSDDVWKDDPSNLVSSFNRCDCGDTYVDHHVFFTMRGAKAGLNHFSYEVRDFDDVMMGHEHLMKQNRYQHMWGIGRHRLGAQVYDYWCDPWGRVHEHWTDSDVLNARTLPGLAEAGKGTFAQWGESMPARFATYAVD
jgi:catechol 2,3-dioxygenase-like lactoylglutathione lyase family enzyme